MFQKKQGFVLKNASISYDKKQNWTFLEFLLTQWLSMATFLRLNFGGSGKIQNFVPKNRFWKKKYRRLWESLFFQSHSAAKLLLLALFLKKGIFLGKTYLLFFRKSQVLKSLRKFVISLAFCCNFVTFSDFRKKDDFFFRKTRFFWKKTQSLQVLRFFTISVAFYGNFSPLHF